MFDSVDASDTIAEVLRERRDRPARLIVFSTPAKRPQMQNEWSATDAVQPERPPEAS